MFFTANPKLNIDSVRKLPDCPPLSFKKKKKIQIQNKTNNLLDLKVYRGEFQSPLHLHRMNKWTNKA